MKKNIIKIFCICSIGILSLTQISCNDLFDQEPQGEWLDGDNPGGSFETDVFTLYAKIRGFNVSAGNGPLAIHNYRSEDIEKGSTAADGNLDGKMFDDFEYTAGNGLINGYWNGNYSMIHGANDILENIKEYVEAGNTLTDHEVILKSEAHFFRAFGFFNLVRAFGEVPLIDFKIQENSYEGNIAKSPVIDIYKLIDSDLTEAEKNLPKQWNSMFTGRLTWGAARSLHARTYMMRNDWTNMHIAATDVITSGIYNLNTPFDKIFRESGENSSESILELQCTATESMTNSNTIGSEYAQVQGVRGAGVWNLGWGMHTPTQFLADAFESGDPRKNETLLYFYPADADAATIANTPENKPWGEKPMSQSGVVNKYYNKKVYTDPSFRTKFAKSGYWMNIRIIRFSDVVLMAAESANELGNTPDALKYLEMVRARARGTANVLPEVTTTDKTLLRNAVKHERRIELAMEWDRFYDLVRWGDASSVLGKYQPKHALLPIPQPAIDNSNGVLIQNPNY